ncbi:MAG: hypothetical protein E7325_05080 [Clostridiales bacterium]|nr:hypothetical protein [Clostridiales bacterium]
MSFFDFLYQMIIGPLHLLFDTIFCLALAILQNPGLTIIVLSLVVNLLVLPLYRRADAVQDEERRQSEKMAPGLAHIRKVFKGDERVMMQQTYYRQNHYKPWHALKGSISLLLEIPFFIAAYNFLSGLQILQGVSFGPIADLGAPDGMLKIAGMSINLLPILMTGINIVSGAIYTKGMPIRSKIQLYGMALLFLVLLYNSPAGLVFYWTLNNLFSLVKNCAARLKKPRMVLWVFFSLAGIILGIFFTAVRPLNGFARQAAAVAAALALQIPLIREILIGKKEKEGRLRPRPAAARNIREEKGLFWCSAILLSVLTGLLIPSAVVKASVAEFIDSSHPANPIRYLLWSGAMGFGTFCVWGGVFRYLTAREKRARVSLIFAIAALGCTITFMFFGKEYGNLSSLLKYDLPIQIRGKGLLLNTGALILIAGAMIFLFRKNRKILNAVMAAGMIALCVLSGINMVNIHSEYQNIQVASLRNSREKPSFALDKSGKNVVVIMMDRGIGSFVPFLFEEKPELKKQFEGFTWYPNTLSYGAHTLVGAPALFGGYEYLPEKIEARTDTPLVTKHNEALKIMPLNFLNEKYNVTVCDPPYANYTWIPSLEIYDEYPEIHTYNTGHSFLEYGDAIHEREDRIRQRNLFCYSLTRSAPVALQTLLYDSGKYNETDVENHIGAKGLNGLRGSFVNAYLALKNMSYMTRITDEGQNTFLMFTNDTMHDVISVQGPAYDPEIRDPESTYNEEHRVKTAWDGRTIRITNDNQEEHYTSDMTAFLQLGVWMDYLRENGVYDNTRIIIVSDHGFSLGFFDMELRRNDPDEWTDAMIYNPLLMVKDFGDSGEIRTDNTFMTNADTPFLAFDGIVKEPRNPFLDVNMSNEAKKDPIHHILQADWHAEKNTGNTFTDPISLTLEGDEVLNREKWTIETQP